jgi:hypothetical protein
MTRLNLKNLNLCNNCKSNPNEIQYFQYIKINYMHFILKV